MKHFGRQKTVCILLFLFFIPGINLLAAPQNTDFIANRGVYLGTWGEYKGATGTSPIITYKLYRNGLAIDKYKKKYFWNQEGRYLSFYRVVNGKIRRRISMWHKLPGKDYAVGVYKYNAGKYLKKSGKGWLPAGTNSVKGKKIEDPDRLVATYLIKRDTRVVGTYKVYPDNIAIDSKNRKRYWKNDGKNITVFKLRYGKKSSVLLDKWQYWGKGRWKGVLGSNRNYFLVKKKNGSDRQGSSKNTTPSEKPGRPIASYLVKPHGSKSIIKSYSVYENNLAIDNKNARYYWNQKGRFISIYRIIKGKKEPGVYEVWVVNGANKWKGTARKNRFNILVKSDPDAEKKKKIAIPEMPEIKGLYETFNTRTQRILNAYRFVKGTAYVLQQRGVFTGPYKIRENRLVVYKGKKRITWIYKDGTFKNKINTHIILRKRQ